jgi:hypothetical protein
MMKKTKIIYKYNISFDRAMEISIALLKIKFNESMLAKEMIEMILKKLNITEENEKQAIKELVKEAILNQKKELK